MLQIVKMSRNDCIRLPIGKEIPTCPGKNANAGLDYEQFLRVQLRNLRFPEPRNNVVLHYGTGRKIKRHIVANVPIATYSNRRIISNSNNPKVTDGDIIGICIRVVFCA